jgi:DNA-directed RNA polymerase specialized sigma24 family protein
MKALGDDELRQIARLRLQGVSIEQVAERLGFAVRTIKRKLQLIRRIWKRGLMT